MIPEYPFMSTVAGMKYGEDSFYNALVSVAWTGGGASILKAIRNVGKQYRVSM